MKRKEQEIKEAKEHVEDMYGEVSPKEYKEMQDSIPTLDFAELRTLREDYEMYLDNDTGDFTAYYRGYCNKCGNEFNFNKTKKGAFPT